MNNDFFWSLESSPSLAHFGIKGMRWGVRRYQNPDGTLTEAGKKRVKKQYVETLHKGVEKYNADNQGRYVRAWNKAAEEFNTGKFEESYKKKHAKNYSVDKWNKAAEDYTEKLVDKYMKEERRKAFESNEYFKEVQDLVKQYDMTSWDEVAKNNQENFFNGW